MDRAAGACGTAVVQEGPPRILGLFPFSANCWENKSERGAARTQTLARLSRGAAAPLQSCALGQALVSGAASCCLFRPVDEDSWLEAIEMWPQWPVAPGSLLLGLFPLCPCGLWDTAGRA